MSQNAVSNIQCVDIFKVNAAQVSLTDAVNTFVRYERKRWSNETETWYRRRLDNLIDYLGASCNLGEIMEVDLEGYYTSLTERDRLYGGNGSRPVSDGGLSPYTLHGHIRAVKRLFRWLFKMGILSVDLAVGLKPPKLPKQGRKGISEENARAIINAARSNPRDYALIRFIESTGVRRGGAEGLRISDLNLGSFDIRVRRRAAVREKGEKVRTVIMSNLALEALEGWLLIRPDIGDDDHVFLAQSPGQAWHPITTVGISSMLDRYKKRLCLKGPCSPHQWRHRWCRRCLEKGMPIGHVSQLAGHSDIKVTHDFYGQFCIDQLQDSYERYYQDIG